jgi:hypothetical protein
MQIHRRTHGSACFRRRLKRTRPIWLRCLHCKRRLVRVDVQDGWTCIPVDHALVVEAQLVCTCGEVRCFHGVRIS